MTKKVRTKVKPPPMGWDKRDMERALFESEITDLFESPPYVNLIFDVVSSPAFQRLRDIRFLGAIDYLISANGSARRKRHTRFEHSLYVGKLAREYAVRQNLTEDQERHLVVAALLHDIGHAPLSHSLEPVFKDRFRLAHHEASGVIINGIVPIGSALPNIFRKHNIDRRHVIDLIDGRTSVSYVDALQSPINIDTIEAITRGFGYIASERTYPNAIDVLTAMVRSEQKDAAVLDRFWEMKGIVYEQLITSKVGILADLVCREYMERHVARFWGGTFFVTESSLRKEHPQLFEMLRRLRVAQLEILAGDAISIPYQQRSFFVDSTVPIEGARSLHFRYKQSKSKGQIRVADFNKVLQASKNRGQATAKLFSTERNKP